MEAVESSIDPTPVAHAVRLAGSQSELARRIGSTQGSVWKWLKGLHPIAPKAALAIEREFGISRHELRPDVYGPALAADAHASAQAAA